MGLEEGTTIPIGWMFATVGGLLAVLIGGFVAYVRERFRHNDREHSEIKTSMGGIDSKIDHILVHHKPQMPPFNE